jgi:hypothetical protein
MVVGYSKQIKDYFVEYLIRWDYANERRDIIQRLEADAAELQRGIDEKIQPSYHILRKRSSHMVEIGSARHVPTNPDVPKCGAKVGNLHRRLEEYRSDKVPKI